jgi:hypothetical protein
VSGIGTNDGENGVDPAEKGTFGLWLLFNAAEPLPWNEVMKEPAKNMLCSEEFEVMELT